MLSNISKRLFCWQEASTEAVRNQFRPLVQFFKMILLKIDSQFIQIIVNM